MSVFEFDWSYDAELDPTPEDGKYTESDYKILYIRELTNLDPADLGKWKELRLEGLRRLLEVGVEAGPGLVLPAPELIEITEWDDQGYAIIRDENGEETFFTMIREAYEGALRWQQSGNRLLTKGGEMLRNEFVLLPLDRFQGNAAFEEYYLRNMTCEPQQAWVFGKSGYINKRCFQTFVEEQMERDGRPYTTHFGHDILPKNYRQPIAASTPRRHLEQVMEKYEKRWKNRGGPGYDHYIEVVVPGVVFDADRKVEERYEGWVPPSPIFHFNRGAEIDHAKSNANY